MIKQLDFLGRELNEGDFVIYVRDYRNPYLTIGRITKIAKQKYSKDKNYMQIESVGIDYLLGERKQKYSADTVYVLRSRKTRLTNLSKIIKIDPSELDDTNRLVLLKGREIQVKRSSTNPKEYSVEKYPELLGTIIDKRYPGIW